MGADQNKESFPYPGVGSTCLCYCSSQKSAYTFCVNEIRLGAGCNQPMRYTSQPIVYMSVQFEGAPYRSTLPQHHRFILRVTAARGFTEINQSINHYYHNYQTIPPPPKLEKGRVVVLQSIYHLTIQQSVPLCLVSRVLQKKIQRVTYRGSKINFLKYSRVIHQKKRIEPLMIKQKSGWKNIEKCPSYGQKTLKSSIFPPKCNLWRLLFYIVLYFFSLDLQWLKVFLLMYSTTIFQKMYFSTLRYWRCRIFTWG